MEEKQDLVELEQEYGEKTYISNKGNELCRFTPKKLPRASNEEMIQITKEDVCIM